MLRKLLPYLILMLLTSVSWAQGMKSVASPSEPHGMVISSVDNPAENIFAINIKNIDGGEIPPFPSGVWLKPGEHTIKGFGGTDTAYAKGALRRFFYSKRRLEPLTLDVEEGMAYYIGLKAEGPQSKWKIVVWRSEPIDSDEVAAR